MAKYYPIFLDIFNKKCVVVGGGRVAWRKVCSLKEAGALVTVVSPEICPELEKEANITMIRQEYGKSFLEGARLVIASTDDKKVNKQVYDDAVEKGLLVNVVDQPEFCTFIVPASIVRGDLCISISTGGASPAFARNIRIHLEKQFGREYEDFTNLLSRMRKRILEEIHDETIRRDILQTIAGLDMLEYLKVKGVEETEKKILEIVSEKVHYTE